MAERSRIIQAALNGIELQFKTSSRLFSPRYIDKSTLAILSLAKFGDDENVLDLGCGYGVMGIYTAKKIGTQRVVMLDNDPDAVRLSRENAELNGVAGMNIYQSDGFRNLRETAFTMILCNPPYHTDFAVAKHFVHKGFNRLQIGGRMFMSAKRELWYKKKLYGIFGNVNIRHKDGYSIFMAVKHSNTYAKNHAASEK